MIGRGCFLSLVCSLPLIRSIIPACLKPFRAATSTCLVFTAGFTTLGVELSAARLLDPWFGNSLIVWAALIGLILSYLAMGYWLGGRHGRPLTASRHAVATRISRRALRRWG